jgi:hypothetical protein
MAGEYYRLDNIVKKYFSFSITSVERASYGCIFEAHQMPGGQIEERIRKWVRRRLRTRGLSVALARNIGRPPAWVSMYVAGDRDADLDTSLNILTFFGVSILEVGQLPEDQLELDIRLAVHMLNADGKATTKDVIDSLLARQPVALPAEKPASGSPPARPRQADKSRGTRKAGRRVG